MKTILILLLPLTLLFSCFKKNNDKEVVEIYPQYRIAYEYIVPDSSKQKYAEFVTKTITATTSNVNSGDQDNVIRQIEETGFKIFAKNIEGLEISKCNSCYWVFIEKSSLNEKQLIIFDSLNKLY